MQNLKCIGVEDYVTSSNFRDEYKKNHRFLDVFKELHHKKKPSKSLDEFYCRKHKRLSDNEEKAKNGTIQVELSPTSIPKNGTADSRK